MIVVPVCVRFLMLVMGLERGDIFVVFTDGCWLVLRVVDEWECY